MDFCHDLHLLQKAVSLMTGERYTYWDGPLTMALFTAGIFYRYMSMLQRTGKGRWEREYESKYLAPGFWLHLTGVWLEYGAPCLLNLGGGAIEG